MAQRHLLIVDDSPLVTDALRVLCEASGYRVSVAATAADAVTRYVADPPSVMVLDLTLPDGSGLSVLDQLVERHHTPRTVVLTGHDDPAIRERCLARGCLAVLVKPVPVRELLAQVQSIETALP